MSLTAKSKLKIVTTIGNVQGIIFIASKPPNQKFFKYLFKESNQEKSNSIIGKITLNICKVDRPTETEKIADKKGKDIEKI